MQPWTEKEVAALIIAILAGVISVISAFITLHSSKKSAFLNSVTAERSKWIEKLRTNIASYSSSALNMSYMMGAGHIATGSSEHNAAIQKLNELNSLIKLQLNPKGKIDENIIKIIDKLPSLAEKVDGTDARELEKHLIAHSQWLLKGEWEKVKWEASWVTGTRAKIREMSYNFTYRSYVKTHPIPGI